MVIRSGKAASTRLVLPVPGGPASRAGTPSVRSAQRLDVGHADEYAGPVDLPAWSGDRAGRGLRGGSLRRGRRCRRGGRVGSRRRGGGGLGRGGGLGGDGGGCGGGRGVGLVVERLAGNAAGLGPVGEGGQGVADCAGRPAEVFGDLADRVRAGAGGEPLGNLAAKLAVAEPALRGRGGNSGGGHREYLRENARAGNCGRARASPLPRLLIAGEFPPEFPGTPRRYLAFSGAVNAFPPRNSQFPRQFPRNSSLTAAELITVRPRTFPAAAGRLSRARPRRPPATSRTCPHLAARPRGAGRARACGHGPGGQYLILHGYEATDRRPGINVRHASAARHSPLF